MSLHLFPRAAGISALSPQFQPQSANSAHLSGHLQEKASAVNSSTLMRVAALREIGGYSEEFWLDLSDVYTFQAMYFKGRYIYVASDLVLQHSLSGMDYDKERPANGIGIFSLPRAPTSIYILRR